MKIRKMLIFMNSVSEEVKENEEPRVDDSMTHDIYVFYIDL